MYTGMQKPFLSLPTSIFTLRVIDTEEGIEIPINITPTTIIVVATMTIVGNTVASVMI